MCVIGPVGAGLAETGVPGFSGLTREEGWWFRVWADLGGNGWARGERVWFEIGGVGVGRVGGGGGWYSDCL